MDLLLALIELFSLSVTADELRAIIGSKSAISFQRGSVDTKLQVEGVVPHQPFFSVNKDKCSFVWCKNLDRSFFRFVTIHACDRQTDGQTDRILIARPRLHYMQRGKNGIHASLVHSVCNRSRAVDFHVFSICWGIFVQSWHFS